MEPHICKSGKEDLQSEIHNLIAERTVAAASLRKSVSFLKLRIANPQSPICNCGKAVAERQLWKGDLWKHSCGTKIAEIDLQKSVLRKQPCGIELAEEDLISEVC